eukprot:jgi/Hompol1/3660/HPOL_003313-RA
MPYTDPNIEPSHHTVDAAELGTWLYPTNKPVRDYQFNIVQRALFCNTMVALPTGLGKTFLAAVVMFNYFRWFPNGIILFMAPTRPLVAQQIEACHNIAGIPQSATQELTGTTTRADLREQIWQTKRVIFATPHVIQNDLKADIFPYDKVVLVVVDEAHHALGKFAYCNVISMLCQRGARFRVLALTATPGSDMTSVQKIVTNLLIQHIEIRTEESFDLREYIHRRRMDEIIVQPHAELANVIEAFAKIVNPYFERLCDNKVFYERDSRRVMSFTLIAARSTWMEANGYASKNSNVINNDFGIAFSMAHCMQLLITHGIRSFYVSMMSYINETKPSDKGVMTARMQLIANPELQRLLAHVKAQMAKPGFCSHPKLDRLTSTILNHFTEFRDREAANGMNMDSQNAPQTRVMVFSQYRESVEEIVDILNQHQPMLRVMAFVGQAAKKNSASKGTTQKEQLEVISKFQTGNYNVLVATLIGEEGLDIGEVDLIVCFDGQSSPIRMLQRIGRTGRKREGRIVVLLSKGKEEESHHGAQSKYKAVQKAIMEGKRLTMYNGPASHVLPEMARPVCVKKDFVIVDYQRAPEKVSRSKSKTAASVASAAAASTESIPFDGKDEFDKALEQDRDLFGHIDRSMIDLSLSRFVHWQSHLLPVKHVSRTCRSKTLVKIVNLCDALLLEETSDKKRPAVESMLKDIAKGGNCDTRPNTLFNLKAKRPSTRDTPASASKASTSRPPSVLKRPIVEVISSGSEDECLVDADGNDKIDRLLLKTSTKTNRQSTGSASAAVKLPAVSSSNRAEAVAVTHQTDTEQADTPAPLLDQVAETIKQPQPQQSTGADCHTTEAQQSKVERSKDVTTRHRSLDLLASFKFDRRSAVVTKPGLLSAKASVREPVAADDPATNLNQDGVLSVATANAQQQPSDLSRITLPPQRSQHSQRSQQQNERVQAEHTVPSNIAQSAKPDCDLEIPAVTESDQMMEASCPDEIDNGPVTVDPLCPARQYARPTRIRPAKDCVPLDLHFGYYKTFSDLLTDNTGIPDQVQPIADMAPISTIEIPACDPDLIVLDTETKHEPALDPALDTSLNDIDLDDLVSFEDLSDTDLAAVSFSQIALGQQVPPDTTNPKQQSQASASIKSVDAHLAPTDPVLVLASAISTPAPAFRLKRSAPVSVSASSTPFVTPAAHRHLASSSVTTQNSEPIQIANQHQQHKRRILLESSSPSSQQLLDPKSSEIARKASATPGEGDPMTV